ncbi:hypothetical protein [Flavisphingomonas formosensis]|uniref:hypothetical protein n=1 Tax=Flavisphingomonas formosensis TaxID=861534 RepID=UPI0012FA66F3|nr:hypothetical protein [Sphingomonas formosensis]
MLYHLSLAADDPRHAASVIAELWGGRAFPFPPVIAGSWIAMAGDERRTAIEFYPRGTELRRAPGDADAYGLLTGVPRHGPTHAAIGTMLDGDAVFAIAVREGWPAKYCKRGGVFGVIELWVEGCQMIEVLTPEMQREYRDGVTIENWERFLEASGHVAIAA